MKKEKWIPVTKQLPLKDCACYVTCKFNGGVMRVKEAYYFTDEKLFMDRETKMVLDLIATAWMPRYVPEPYNSVED